MSEAQGNDFHHEMIGAMSSLNTHDERKPYTGPFLTDEIQEVAEAYKKLYDAYTEYPDPVYAIIMCNEAIDMLSTEELSVHQMIAHSIEHIKSAITVLETPIEDIYKNRCRSCSFLFEDDQGDWHCDSGKHPGKCKTINQCLEFSHRPLVY